MNSRIVPEKEIFLFHEFQSQWMVWFKENLPGFSWIFPWKYGGFIAFDGAVSPTTTEDATGGCNLPRQSVMGGQNLGRLNIVKNIRWLMLIDVDFDIV